MKFAPLSEDRLSLPGGGHHIVAAERGEIAWQDVVSLSRGEQRHLNFDFRVPAGHTGSILRVLRVPAGARLTLSVNLRVGAGANWATIVAVRGEGEVTIQRVTSAIGARAKVFLATVAVLAGQAKLQVDDDIRAESPETNLALRTHTVLHDEARADVRGRIVLPKSPGSEVEQSLCHLLVGQGARGRAIPELDVAEQDVRCRHRSFIGRAKEAERFFLQSRGLTEVQVDRLLAQGFIGAALQGAPSEVVERVLNELQLAV